MSTAGIFSHCEPPNAVSFSDGTTPDFRTARRQVAIEATTPHESDHKWYIILLTRYAHLRDKHGELDSRILVSDFHNQPTNIQNAVWAGMKHVRIHISDVFPHQRSLEKITERYPGMQRLREDAANGNKISQGYLEFLQKEMLKLMLQSMMCDSPVTRFISFATALRNAWGYNLSLHGDSFEPTVDFEKLVSPDNPGRTLHHVTKINARSDAIFSAVTDEVLNSQYPSPFTALHSLAKCRAFDEGNTPDLLWMENARITSLEAMFPFESQRYQPMMQGLREVPSRLSPRTQMADVAAQFANQIYERQGLIEVARQFQFVTFNGERIYEDTAAEKIRLWKAEGYI